MLKWLARLILRKELEKIERYRRIDEMSMYIDLDTSDQLAYWRSLAKWSMDKNARRWAFERLNKLLIKLAKVTNEDSHNFYVLQGMIAEMDNFIQMPRIVEDKLKEVYAEIEGMKKPPLVLNEADPISKEFE